MKTDASAIANYFIQKGINTGKEVTMLKLLKLVYIAHGYSLAILNKSFLNSDFDEVQAWMYGPVIPSLYHYLKRYKDKEIDECISFVTFDEEFNVKEEKIPQVNDENLQSLLNKVWELYSDLTPSRLVSLLHKQGTPWHYCYYNLGQNSIIPDELTKMYYDKLVSSIIGG